jgi:uncharacterized lipoprotein
MRSLSLCLVALLLAAVVSACGANPTVPAHRSGSSRAEAGPTTPPDSTNGVTRGGNGFGSGN